MRQEEPEVPRGRGPSALPHRAAVIKRRRGGELQGQGTRLTRAKARSVVGAFSRADFASHPGWGRSRSASAGSRRELSPKMKPTVAAGAAHAVAFDAPGNFVQVIVEAIRRSRSFVRVPETAAQLLRIVVGAFQTRSRGKATAGEGRISLAQGVRLECLVVGYPPPMSRR
jgi:hypothetical protein